MKTKLHLIAIITLFTINSNSQTFQKSISTNSQEHYHDLNIEPTLDGTANFYIAGNLFDGSMTNYTPTIKRVDSSGNIIWIKNYTSSLPNARIFDIEPFRILGLPPMLAVTGSIDVGGTKNVFIAKIDAATGNFIDARHYDIVSPNFNSRGLHISYVENDADGDGIIEEGFVVGGYFSDSYITNTNALNIGFVMRVYSTLSLFWTIEIDSNSTNADFDAVNSITETSDGYFLTGSANDVTTSQLAVLAHKIDFGGNFVWDKSYVFGNSQDVSVDAYYDATTQEIFMLSNYSISHLFGVTVFDNLTGVIDASQSWYAAANEVNKYGFTIMPSLTSNDNLIITGYDRNENWSSGGSSFSGQSNLFVYEFEKATGNQVGPNYQYQVTHTEPAGDEFNFWNGQMPFIYYPDISFNGEISGLANYLHVGYKTDPVVNFTEADLFKTLSDKKNECENIEIVFNPTPLTKTDITVISGSTPNNENPLFLMENSITYVDTTCDSSLAVEDNTLFGTTLYPNPTVDYVYTTALDAISFVVFDSLGRTIDKGSINSNGSIFLGNLKSGMYFVKIINMNNQSQSFKILKK